MLVTLYYIKDDDYVPTPARRGRVCVTWVGRPDSPCAGCCHNKRMTKTARGVPTVVVGIAGARVWRRWLLRGGALEEGRAQVGIRQAAYVGWGNPLYLPPSTPPVW